MAKGSRGRRRITSRKFRSAPYPVHYNHDILEALHQKKCSKALEKKDWEDATCSVCMEYPHNAVLLLCSSHDKGCHPYMCGTSFRHSNCLDQYKKAYTKVVPSNRGLPLQSSLDSAVDVSDSGLAIEKCEVAELACPLCRGQVKGWTVVEPAREYLNAKKRSCMQDGCSFVGNYKELRKHVKAEHPSARPREVDPSLEQKWSRLERQRERDDVVSTIRSTTPGAMFFGDYVIEGNNYGFETEEDEGGFDLGGGETNGGFEVGGLDRELVNVFLLIHAFGASANDFSRRPRQPERALNHTVDGAVGIRHNSPVGGVDSSDDDDDDDDDEANDNDDDGGGISLASRLRRHGRVLLGRSGRRRRRRAVQDG